MAMKRAEWSAKPENADFKHLRGVSSFDDSSIRRMLRSAYDDFVGDELELEMENYRGHAELPNHGGKGWLEIGQLRDRADLKFFWEIFVQKQIFFFDQESTILMKLPQEERW
jgi:hypothetical protein